MVTLANILLARAGIPAVVSNIALVIHWVYPTIPAPKTVFGQSLPSPEVPVLPAPLFVPIVILPFVNVSRKLVYVLDI